MYMILVRQKEVGDPFHRRIALLDRRKTEMMPSLSERLSHSSTDCLDAS